jgi:hypothetical protein
MLIHDGDRRVRLLRLTLVSETVQLVHVEVLTVALTVRNASSAARWYRIDINGNPGDRRDLDEPRLPLSPGPGKQADLVARLSEHIANTDSAHE